LWFCLTSDFYFELIWLGVLYTDLSFWRILVQTKIDRITNSDRCADWPKLESIFTIFTILSSQNSKPSQITSNTSLGTPKYWQVVIIKVSFDIKNGKWHPATVVVVGKWTLLGGNHYQKILLHCNVRWELRRL